MSVLHDQVRFADRRLTRQRRWDLLPTALMALAVPAILPILLPKLVVWQRPDWAVDFWPLLWLSAAVFLAAAVVEGRLRFSRRGTLDAAVEIDRRLDLAERTSSALTLPPELRDAPIGRLLTEDAERKLQGLDLGDSFPVRIPRTAVGSILLLIVGGLIGFLIPDAVARPIDPIAAGAPVDETTRQEVDEALIEVLEESARQAEEAGLTETEAMLERLRNEAAQGTDGDAPNREASLAKINDLKEKLQERARQLGDAEKMRDAFRELGELASGPADRLVEALEEGDFAQAAEALEQLMSDWSEGEISEADRQAVADQLADLAQAARAEAERARAEREDLDQRIERARAEGRAEEAAELERKREGLAGSERLEEAAERLAEASRQAEEAAEAQREAAESAEAAEQAAQAAEAARAAAEAARSEAEAAESSPGPEGETPEERAARIEQARERAEQAERQAEQAEAEAAERQQQAEAARERAEQADAEAQQALDEIRQEIEAARQASEELETIDGALERIGDLKGRLQREGEGDGEAQPRGGRGRGGARNREGIPGQGEGEGNGRGERAESESDYGTFESRNETDPQSGEVVVGGPAGGPNRTGDSRVSTREAIAEALSEETDPVGEQRLPRSRRDHVRDYFERLRTREK